MSVFPPLPEGEEEDNDNDEEEGEEGEGEGEAADTSMPAVVPVPDPVLSRDGPGVLADAEDVVTLLSPRPELGLGPTTFDGAPVDGASVATPVVADKELGLGLRALAQPRSATFDGTLVSVWPESQTDHDWHSLTFKK